MKKVKRFFTEWEELLSTPLNSFNDLAKPNKSNPHRQLMHLFTSVYKVKTSTSYKSDIKSAFNYVSALMEEQFHREPIYLNKILNEFSLNEFHSYLKRCMQSEKIHNRHANVLQSAYKTVLNKAIEIKVPNFDRFYLPSSFCYQTRVTERYKPYSLSDRKQIDKAIEIEIARVTSLLSPYEKTDKGRAILDENCALKRGIENLTLDDARWIFENKMDCEPIFHSSNFQSTRAGRIFYKIVKKNNANYRDVYESWGVLSKVTINHLIPFLLKLLKITGMNVESIYNLEINDLVESHPATGKPCLRYWKNRSDGQKLYHLDIFKADLQWLTQSQGQQVRAIFNCILQLTSRLRSVAPLKHKNQLWLYETHVGLIKSLPNTYMVSMAIKTFSKKCGLLRKDKKSSIIETTRFRPTFVSDLVAQGVSIREIQLLMGHKNLYTTMRYLDIHDFGQASRERIKEKLTEIHINSLSSKGRNTKTDTSLSKKNIAPISTPFATCKNIFDPPESVKSLPSYTKGKPCSTYNMCLSCPNVIITKTDLPKLFAMKRDYLTKIQNSRVLDTPFGNVITDNLALLNSILDSQDSEFSNQELEEAEGFSLYIETTELI